MLSLRLEEEIDSLPIMQGRYNTALVFLLLLITTRFNNYITIGLDDLLLLYYITITS